MKQPDILDMLDADRSVLESERQRNRVRFPAGGELTDLMHAAGFTGRITHATNAQGESIGETWEERCAREDAVSCEIHMQGVR